MADLRSLVYDTSRGGAARRPETSDRTSIDKQIKRTINRVPEKYRRTFWEEEMLRNDCGDFACKIAFE